MWGPNFDAKDPEDLIGMGLLTAMGNSGRVLSPVLLGIIPK